MTKLVWQPDLTIAAARAAGLEIGAVEIEILPRPHKQPGRLPVGKMAVYVSARPGRCSRSARPDRTATPASAAITMRLDVR